MNLPYQLRIFSRWKLLDFAELKRSSISFFDIERPETAVSRWSRARTRAAKVRSWCGVSLCIFVEVLKIRTLSSLSGGKRFVKR